MLALLSIALLTSTSHAQREQSPIEQPDLVKLLATLAFATNPTSDVVRFRRSALTPSRSATTGMQDWGGAKNEHGHTRELNLDIPGTISDGAFTDYDDDMYGEESYEEHKPYTGEHPSEQKTASSGSSGGYELEDFGSSGSSASPTEEDARDAWASQQRKSRWEYGHNEALDQVKSFESAKSAWIKQMDKKGSRYVSNDAAKAAYIAKVFEPIVQPAAPVPVEIEKAAWIGQMTQEGKQFQSAEAAKSEWIAQMDKKNKRFAASPASAMDKAKAAWISQMDKKGRSFTSPYEATNEYVSKVFDPVVKSVPAVPLDQSKAAWINTMTEKGKKYTSVDEAKAAWIAQMDAKKNKQWGGGSSAPPQQASEFSPFQAASAKTAGTNAGRHGNLQGGSTGSGKKWWR